MADHFGVGQLAREGREEGEFIERWTVFLQWTRRTIPRWSRQA